MAAYVCAQDARPVRSSQTLERVRVLRQLQPGAAEVANAKQNAMRTHAGDCRRLEQLHGKQ